MLIVNIEGVVEPEENTNFSTRKIIRKESAIDAKSRVKYDEDPDICRS